MSRFRDIAADSGVWLMVGSFAATGPDPDHYYNTTAVIDGTQSDAPITATYQKMHLFDIDIPGGEVQKESAYIAPEASCLHPRSGYRNRTVHLTTALPETLPGAVDRG